jgi:hypothetical protein
MLLGLTRPPVTGVNFTQTPGGVNIEPPEPDGRLISIYVTLAEEDGDPDSNPGTATSPCTYTYTATDLLGVVRATFITPKHQRPAIGRHLPATYGVGLQIDERTFELYLTDEKLDVANCG